jgi:hypothetical protein
VPQRDHAGAALRAVPRGRLAAKALLRGTTEFPAPTGSLVFRSFG